MLFRSSTSVRQGYLDVNFPLHPATNSSDDVAQLVETLLCDIADHGDAMTHYDILQALAIATAVRLAMADAAAKPGVDFSLELLDVVVDAVPEKGYCA